MTKDEGLVVREYTAFTFSLRKLKLLHLHGIYLRHFFLLD